MSLTVDELEQRLGDHIRTHRLAKNIQQAVLAGRAGVAVSALRNLESGRGASVKTLLSVVRALGREEWLNTVAPVATINPLTLTRQAQPRVRARSPRKKTVPGTSKARVD